MSDYIGELQAVFAKLHNDRLSTQISLSHDPVSGTRPVASLRLTL